MTQWPLVLAALALGAASVPHCAVMCAAPCAALTNGAARASVAFHAARAAGYMAGGAVAASSVAALGEWSLAAPALRPVWTLMHLTFLALGAYWVITGRALTLLRREAPLPQVVVVRRSRSLRATIAGLAWVAWPCATLQAALLLAALASDAAGGALVMGSFALASIPGLVALPWLWTRWRRGQAQALPAGHVGALGQRIAGAGLMLASGWALTHGLVTSFVAWCAA